MMLNTTRWSIYNEDSVISRYSKLEGGNKVTEFILELKKNKLEIE